MLDNLFYQSSMPPGDLHATHNLMLVSLSFIVAFFSSFISLYIYKNTVQDVNRSYLWIFLGALTLGLGIWTVHFINIEALIVPINISYDPLLAILSMIFVITATAIAFFITSSKQCNFSSIAIGGIVVGIGICIMHYLGMFAMLGLHIRIIPRYFILYILITIICTQTVMWSMINIDRLPQKYLEYGRLCFSLIMGATICGVQYIGMASAMFYSYHHKITSPSNAISDEFVSVALTLTTILIISEGLIFALYQTKMTDYEKSTRAILITVADGIMQIQTNGIIENCNPAAEKIFGFDQQTLVGENFYNFIKAKYENEEPLDMSQLFNSGQNQNIEVIGCKKNGDYFSGEISISKLKVNYSDFFVITIRDISKRIQNEEKLHILNQNLIELARRAGMIEVTNSVLHNVGNVLNSINTSASTINEKINNSEVPTLTEIAKLIEDHRDHISDFLTKDEKGKKCLEFIVILAKVLPQEQVNVMEEVSSLTYQVEYVKHIIKMQQMLEGSSDLLEEVDVSSVINDALSINGLNKTSKFLIKIQCENVPRLLLKKVKLVQIIVNIIQNAKAAVMENEKDLKMISISSFIENNNLVIEIEDNGTGIESDVLKKIFSFGFTTKKHGHGFGLHSSLISSKEMGGILIAQSQGKGMGAKFRLEVPYQHAKSFAEISR